MSGSSIGDNRTGIASAGQRAQDMVEGVKEFGPTSEGNALDTSRVRVHYAKETGKFGHVPPPKGAMAKAKTAAKGAKGDRPVLLMDKLGERLVFERMGTRLYVALLSKLEAYGSFKGGPKHADLTDILGQEYAHFTMLKNAIEDMGGDPTAVTPSANLQAIAGHGIQKILSDPRTDLVQGLEAILIAELADNDGWEALTELAENAGEHDLAEQFEQARLTEEDHLSKVRSWLAAAQGRSTPRTAS